MKRLITVAIVALSLLTMTIVACGGGASVENPSDDHSYCLPFPLLKGHSLF